MLDTGYESMKGQAHCTMVEEGGQKKFESMQGCILLTYLSVIFSKTVQKFAQKCQYLTLIDQSVPLDNFYITFYLRTNQQMSRVSGQLSHCSEKQNMA